MTLTTGLTVVLPHNLDSLEPIEVLDRFGLRSAFVERYALAALPMEWDKAEGFYVLLSPLARDNTFSAYVGQTDYSFKSRLKDHDGSKDYWSLAVLFKREGEPFNRNETHYLEGIMVDALKSSPNVDSFNKKPTGDKNLPDHEKAYMNSILLAALRVLFMRGYRNAHLGGITRNLETQMDVNKGRHAAVITGPVAIAELTTRPSEVTKEVPTTDNGEVFSLLKQWRLSEMKAAGFSAAWAVIRDDGLRSIIEKNPTTLVELGAVPGVSTNFVTKYGNSLLTQLALLKQ